MKMSSATSVWEMTMKKVMKSLFVSCAMAQLTSLAMEEQSKTDYLSKISPGTVNAANIC